MRFGWWDSEQSRANSVHYTYWDLLRRVAIASKPNKEELRRILPELVEWLRLHGFEPVLDMEGGAMSSAAEAVSRSELPKLNPELVIVLGGDGTMLAVARHVWPSSEKG